MDEQEAKRISKFLSYVLRHRPDEIGIQLDDSGWVEVDTLLDAMCRQGKHITREQVDEVVTTNDKQRFVISDDATRIRASQGHSVDIDLGYDPGEPPDVLYHGTVDRFIDAIRVEGLTKGSRHHVHLSATRDTAITVGQRRGKPVVLLIRAIAMHDDGYEFFLTPNGVWLTDHVPVEFIEFP